MTQFNPEKIIIDGLPGAEQDEFSQHLRSLYSKLGRQECIDAVKQARAITFENNFHLTFVDHLFWLLLYEINTSQATKAELAPRAELYKGWVANQFYFKEEGEEGNKRVACAILEPVCRISGVTSL